MDRFWFKIRTWVDIVEGSIDICHAYNIEVSLESLLDRTDEHVECLRYLDKSPISDQSTRTKEGNDDIGLAPEVEDLVVGSAFIY